MNELDQSPLLLTPSADEGQTLPPVPASIAPTAGQLLQEARKVSGLSLEQLSSRVKVSVARLLALEHDRLDEWPDANVVRAVAASVCRQLRLDPAVVLDLLPKAQQKAIVLPATQTAAGFRDQSVFNLRGRSRVMRMVMTLVLGLAALGLLVFLAGPKLQSEWVRLSDQGRIVGAPQTGPVLLEPVLPPDAGPTDTRAVAGMESASAPAVAEPMDRQPLAPKAVAEPKGIEKSAASLGASGAAPVPVLSFKARGTTWIEVIDAKGTVLLRRTMVAGDTAAASGELPLSVVVGRADYTEVTVRGQVLILEPSPDNVARLKVQ